MKLKPVKFRKNRRIPYEYIYGRFIEKAKSFSIKELSELIDRKEKWIEWYVYDGKERITRRLLESLCRKLDIPVSDHSGHRSTENKIFLYCDCGNELMASNSFVSDSYDKDWNNHVLFKCSKCGKELDFDFDVPVPLRWAEDGGYEDDNSRTSNI
jgi:hypothetical protein